MVWGGSVVNSTLECWSFLLNGWGEVEGAKLYGTIPRQKTSVFLLASALYAVYHSCLD